MLRHIFHTTLLVNGGLMLFLAGKVLTGSPIDVRTALRLLPDGLLLSLLLRYVLLDPERRNEEKAARDRRHWSF